MIWLSRILIPVTILLHLSSLHCSVSQTGLSALTSSSDWNSNGKTASAPSTYQLTSPPFATPTRSWTPKICAFGAKSCQVGKRHYRLKEKFQPPAELYGHCLICQCIPLLERGVVQLYGKVKCAKIDLECPLPRCANPVLLKGRCCRSCPGQLTLFEDTYSLIPPGYDAQVEQAIRRASGHRRDTKRYRGVLVGRNVMSRTAIFTHAVAVIDLQVTSYSILYTIRHASLIRPKDVQLLDPSGKILLQNRLTSDDQDRKFCGEWNEVDKSLVKLIHKGKVSVMITSQSYPAGEVAGQLERDSSDYVETFGAILVSPRLDGIGGYASIVYGLRSRRITYSIYHVGLFDSHQYSKQEYFVTIEKRTKILHQQSKRSKKMRKLKGMWTKINKRNRKMLAKGRLRLRVTLKGGNTIMGYILPTFLCGTYQAVLSSANALTNGREVVALPSSGIVVMIPINGNQLVYRVELINMPSIVTSITIEGPLNKEGRQSIRKTITHSFVRNTTTYFDGVAVGRWTGLRTKDIAMLQMGYIFINVATISSRLSLIRGRVQHVEPLGNIDMYSSRPLLLTSPLNALTGVVGQAWISVTNNCLLAYQIQVGGLVAHADDLTALLNGDYNAPGTTGSPDATYTVIITDFIEGMARGAIRGISPAVFLSLNNGTSYLHMEVYGINLGEITTNLTIPNNCWKIPKNNSVPDVFVDENGNPIPSQNCLGEGITWTYDNDTCKTCSCHLGEVQCHDVVCPELTCNSQHVVGNGCCPVCEEITTTGSPVSEDTNENPPGACFYPGDERWYPVGTDWFPYIPGSGYSTCAKCRCSNNGSSYNCSRIACPKLSCPASVATKEEKTDCCPKCPEENTVESTTSRTTTAGKKNLDCLYGNQTYAHNTKWSPVIPPFGVMRCYICKCSNGEIKCGMKNRCKKKFCQHSTCKKNKNEDKKRKRNKKGKRRKKQKDPREP